MAPPLPWVYPYQEDGPRLGTVVLRPIVPITLVGTEVGPPSLALVDSGCEYVLAAPWLASAVGIDPGGSDRRLDLGIGGQTVEVRFADLTMRLHPPDGDDDDFIEWQAEVGFVHHWRPTWPILVGQLGFLDKLTVSMSRLSQHVAIEEHDDVRPSVRGPLRQRTVRSRWRGPAPCLRSPGRARSSRLGRRRDLQLQ